MLVDGGRPTPTRGPAGRKMKRNAARPRGKAPRTSWYLHLERSLFAVLMCVSLWWIHEQVKSRDVALWNGDRHVRLYGDFTHVSRERVLDTVNTAIRDGVSYDGLRALERALSADPWVRRAELERVWPGGVNVRISENRAITRWGDNALLSEEGRVFSPASIPADVEQQNLPVLYSASVDRAQRLTALLHALRGIVEPRGMKVTALRENEQFSVEMWLDERIHVVLGSKDMEARVRRMIAIHDALALDDIQYVDLRYPTGMAVRYAEEGARE